MPTTNTNTHTSNKHTLQNEVVCRGKGSWWHSGFKLLTPTERGQKNLAAHWPTCWGVKMQNMANLTFVVNAACPLSLINDYRGFAQKPNCSLVQEFFTDQEAKWRPTLQLSIQADEDIKPGDQLLVDYGANWVDDDSMAEADDVGLEVRRLHTHVHMHTSPAQHAFACMRRKSTRRRAL